MSDDTSQKKERLFSKLLVERKTGDLYADCFRFLNSESWFHQGELLAKNLGLSSEEVSGKTCLDAGCGHGALVYQLAKAGAKEVYGVDLEPAVPQEIFQPLNNIHFLKSSILNLPLPDSFFDLVVCTGVLHHTIDPKKGFKELVRVLKPGGRLVLGIYGKHGLFPYFLSFIRIFTVRTGIIPQEVVKGLIKLLNLSPMVRYQILDYLYVPLLKRFSPKEIKNAFFLENGLENPERIYNLNPKQAKFYREHQTVYTYDPRTFCSRLLFGHGFIVMEGTKPQR